MKHSLMMMCGALVALLGISAPAKSWADCLIGSQEGMAGSIQDQRTIRFDVASVHQHESNGGFGPHTVKLGFEGDSYGATNVTLKMVISSAYGIDEGEIFGGPSWVDGDEYDIEARFDVRLLQTATLEESRNIKRKMLRNFLAERFNLTVECEKKVLPVYALVVAGGEPKFRAATAGNTYSEGILNASGVPMGPHFVNFKFMVGHVEIESQGAPISSFILRLAQNAKELQLDRKVVDHTGLKGSYDFKLKCEVPWDGGRYPQMSNHADFEKPDNTPDGSDSSLFEAIQRQLGLKLVSTKEPVSVLYIQSIDRPAAN